MGGADVVIGTRGPNDYHPDHRLHTGVLVQDRPPTMVTGALHLPRCSPAAQLQTPVFMYYGGTVSRKPNEYPSQTSSSSLDSVMEKKLERPGGDGNPSFLEGGANGHEGLNPERRPRSASRASRPFANGHASRNMGVANRFRKDLIEWYGEEQGKKVEIRPRPFEICEYRAASPTKPPSRNSSRSFLKITPTTFFSKPSTLRRSFAPGRDGPA